MYKLHLHLKLKMYISITERPPPPPNGSPLTLADIFRIPSLRLDWCLVPKVASTSISQLLLRHLPKTRQLQTLPIMDEIRDIANLINIFD